MRKIGVIAWKELYVTFRDRNLILIMFLTPIVLSTIMGLAFGGFGSDSGISPFQDIPVAVVNLDQGFNLADEIELGDGEEIDLDPSLNDIEFEVGGETINLGRQLQLNANLGITETDLSAANASFNFGEVLADLLLAQAVTETQTATVTSGITFDQLSCPLFEDEGEEETPFGFSGSLEDLLAAEAVIDVETARAGVDQGVYAAAVIIPVDFTRELLPRFDFLDEADEGGAADEGTLSSAGMVEVYAGPGQPIAASIVRAVVEGIVNQLVRLSVAVDAVLTTSADMLLEALDLISLEDLDLSGLEPELVTQSLQNLDASILDPLTCLLLPGAGNIQVEQKALEEIQTRSAFAFILILLGSAQAMFFAMFTGIFGINSIYEEQDNWTLQRLVASPTPRSTILAGKLVGNVVVVTAQLVILFAAFTLIASLVEGVPTFIWGTNVAALLAVILGIALFVSGLGVLVVGLARNPEQVRFVGPMIAATLGALGGSFGFRLPQQIAGISPVWWGSEALLRVSNGETSALAVPLFVLFGVGIVTFTLGAVLFRRRLDL